jgi:hypothetical protein
MPTVPAKIVTCLRTLLKRRHMNTTIKGLGVLAMLWALAGCSTGMAMREGEPTLGVYGVGASRAPVEVPRGRAIASSTEVNGVSPATEECGPGSMGD